MISVVIPTCNRNELLARCLERLVPGAQTLNADQYEVVVTDDSSNDGAERLIHSRFPSVRWVRGPRRGPAANRNNGARAARGDWNAFTDDDCIPDACWLKELAAAIEPGVQVYEGKTECRDGLGALDEAPVNLTGGKLWSCNLMVARKVFDAVDGFDEGFPFAACEDMDLQNRLNKLGLQCKFVPRASVDHPPRPRRLFIARARTWESRVRLQFKEGRMISPWRWLPVHLMKVRIREMLDTLPSPAVILYGSSLLVEFPYVLFHLSEWEKLHRPDTR